MRVSFYNVKWIWKTLQSLDTTLRIMPEHLIVTYETLHEIALATFPVPPPVILMLGHDTQATEAFLPATLVCQAIPPLGPSVSLPPAETLCPPIHHPLITRTLLEHYCFTEAFPHPLHDAQSPCEALSQNPVPLRRVHHNCDHTVSGIIMYLMSFSFR